MNEDTVKGKWLGLKGELVSMWGKLTHDELDRTEGNLAAVVGLIQEKYGETKEAVTDKIKHLFGTAEDQGAAMMDKAKTFVADKSEQAKDKIKGMAQNTENKMNTENNKH